MITKSAAQPHSNAVTSMYYRAAVRAIALVLGVLAVVFLAWLCFENQDSLKRGLVVVGNAVLVGAAAMDRLAEVKGQYWLAAVALALASAYVLNIKDMVLFASHSPMELTHSRAQVFQMLKTSNRMVKRENCWSAVVLTVSLLLIGTSVVKIAMQGDHFSSEGVLELFLLILKSLGLWALFTSGSDLLVMYCVPETRPLMGPSFDTLANHSLRHAKVLAKEYEKREQALKFVPATKGYRSYD